MGSKLKYGMVGVMFLIAPTILFAQNWLDLSDSTIVWSDEFEGTGAPDAAKWDRPEYNRRSNDNGPDGYWDQDDSFLDGKGNLVITVREIENRNGDADAFDYSVGAVRTKGKFEQQYGIFQTRAKLPTQPGWWVAFWMMQGNVGSEANLGVDGSEVDIMEGFGWTDKINLAIHYDGYGDAHKSTGEKVEIEGIRDGFHTYTLIWSPDEYIFFIDSLERWRTVGGGVCNQPGYMKLTGEISTQDWAINEWWANDPANATYPDSFFVNYVRVYQPDFSANTSVKEILEEGWRVYPNPANEDLQLDVPVTIDPMQLSQISILNEKGQIVTIPDQELLPLVDISTLITGIYYLNFVHEQRSISIRFTKI